MKILMVNKFLHPNGGSETYIFKLGEELIRQGHQVQYFGMEHEKRAVGNRAEIYTANMDFHTGKLQKLFYPFKIVYSKEAYQKIWKVLEDFQPDVVHVNNFNFQLTPSILYAVVKYRKEKNKKINLIYTAHDSQLVCPNHLMQNPITKERCDACLSKGTMQCAKRKCIHGSTVKSLLGTIEAALYKGLKTYKHFDAVICPSQFLKEKLDTDTVLREKTVVLRNFVEVEQCEENTKKEDYVLYFGRYSEEKGIKTLLQVCKNLSEIPFHFAGSGPLEEEIKKVSNIKLYGFLSGKRLTDEIRKAKLVVFPSECYENCPFTVMEAQLCGTPVLASDLGGIPELIEIKSTGELFQAGNVEELTDRISDLWKQPEKLMKYAENCKQVKFDSVSEYVEKILEIYKK